MHIENLYRNQDILLFKECYALEKIHGTSAHLGIDKDGQLKLFSGGEKHQRFASLFDPEGLRSKLLPYGEITIYGEAYGGSQQHMGDTYGAALRFIAFDVMIGGKWLSVPDANEICNQLGIDFVDWKRIPTTLEAIDAERDRESVQAIRNGVGPGKQREGVVLRPLIELTKNNESRVISKHKPEKFGETATPRKVVDPQHQVVLDDANAISIEWVTPMRLEHVLDKFPDHTIADLGKIIPAMIEDVQRESVGEVVWSKEVAGAISRQTAIVYKGKYCKI